MQKERNNRKPRKDKNGLRYCKIRKCTKLQEKVMITNKLREGNYHCPFCENRNTMTYRDNISVCLECDTIWAHLRDGYIITNKGWIGDGGSRDVVKALIELKDFKSQYDESEKTNTI